MQYFTITTVLGALTGLANIVQGSTIPVAPGAPSKFGFTPGATGLMNATTMVWTGPSKGVNVTLHGTADKIIDQLKALDPDWTPQPPRIRTKNTPETSNKRGEIINDGLGTIFCCPVNVFQPTSYWGVADAANHLETGGGSTSVGPHSCVTVSCKTGTGIILCNDQDVTFDINLDEIGWRADMITDYCPQFVPPVDGAICGQHFDSTGWNVIATTC